jgi:hypothetical protein
MERPDHETKKGLAKRSLAKQSAIILAAPTAMITQSTDGIF